jgi:hypothetical protein
MRAPNRSIVARTTALAVVAMVCVVGAGGGSGRASVVCFDLLIERQ